MANSVFLTNNGQTERSVLTLNDSLNVGDATATEALSWPALEMNAVENEDTYNLVISNRAAYPNLDGGLAIFVTDDGRVYIDQPDHRIRISTTELLVIAPLATFTGQAIAKDFVVSNGYAVKTDAVTAHTALFQAYDVNGATYRTFGTLTNADVPSFVISQPAGGALGIVFPTSDPMIIGAWWNNAGTLTVSAAT